MKSPNGSTPKGPISGPVLRVDCDNRALQAAMRITGVTADDLKPKSMHSFESSSGVGLGIELRSAWASKDEQRLQMLAREVETIATSISEAEVERVLGGELAPVIRGDTSQLQKDYIEMQSKKAELNKKKGRDFIERLVDEKVTSMQAQEALDCRLDDCAKRLVEINQVRQDTISKNTAKKTNLKESVDARLAEKNKVEAQRLQQKMARKEESQLEVRRQLETVRAARNAQKEKDKREHDERRKQQEWAREQERLEMHKAQVEREELIWGRKEQQIGDMVQRTKENHLRFSARRPSAVHEDAKHRKMQQVVEKLNSARQRVSDLQSEKVQSLIDSRAKVESKQQANRVAIKEIRKEQIKRFRKKAWEDVDNAYSAREATLQEATQHLKGSRGMAKCFVEDSRARISRADVFAREQALANIHLTNARAEALAEQKELFRAHRENRIRDTLVTNGKLEHAVSQIKSSDPAKVNNLLQSFGVHRVDLGEAAKKAKQDPKEGEQMTGALF